MYTNWKQVNDIIDKTLALEPDQRILFLEKKLVNDPEVLSEAKDYLKCIEDANSTNFLAAPFLSSSVLVSELSSTITDKKPIEYIKGRRIGPFEIKRLLGEGGMGSVYFAERVDGEFSQQVAIKFLKSGFYSLYLRERFKREKQLLSRVHHPNIARLLDGGITEDGSPYLIMEYVEGVPLDDYCRDQNLRLEDRLSLFLQICSAVQFAHSKLIIHRDLKPDNIFVTPNGRIKIMDFGIGKSLGSDFDEGLNEFTRPGNIIASFDFAAPEQFSSDDVSIQTDVYGLGSLLYLLATNKRPFNLENKTLGEIETSVRETSPEKPGRLAKPEIGRISKDLEAIILKALRKKPEDRYETVATFMEDIERLKEGLPVNARHGNLRYRTGKYIQRNKTGITAAVLIITVAIFFSVYHLNQLTEERNVAEAEAEKALVVTDFLTGIFLSANPEQNVNDTLTVYNLLDRGKRRIHLMDDKPELQIEFALAIGNSYKNLGTYEEAIKLFVTADSLAQILYGAESLQAANTAFQLGSLHETRRNFEFAKVNYLKAVKVLEQYADLYWNRKAAIYSGLGNTLTELGSIDSAEVYIYKSIEIEKEYNIDVSGLLDTRVNLAKVYRNQGKFELAEKLYRDVLSELETKESPDMTLLAITLNNLGYLQKAGENFSDAERYYRRSLEIQNELYGRDHPNSIIVMQNLASVLSQLGNYDETLQILKETLSVTRNRYGTHWRTGAAIGGIGRFHFQWKEFDLAAERLYESGSIYREVLGTDHIWTAIEDLYHHIARKNSGTFDDTISSLPAYKGLEQSRDFFTYNDSINVTMLIDKTSEFSVVNMEDDIHDLKALLN